MNPNISSSALPLLLPGILLLFLTQEASRASEEVTYSEHISRIFQAKCVNCHQEGAGAPFSLDDYRSVRRRARTIEKVVDIGYMPPWHAIGGDVKMLGDRRLSETELKQIRTWIAAGAPEGDPALLPPPLPERQEWMLGEPDLILTMEEAYSLPAEGPDIYRNFVIATGLTTKKYIKAIDFLPSAPEVVHHSLIFVETSGRSREADGKDPGVGFDSMRFGGLGGNQISGWVPGLSPRPLPEGIAHELPAGSEIVLQTHFHLSGKPEVERSRIGLYFSDEPPRYPSTTLQIPPVFGAFSGIELKPGESDHEIVDRFELPVDLIAFGAHAHAHYRGKSLNMTAELPSGDELVLLNIPKWDMDWQEEYRFAKPVELPRGTSLITRVVWDNSEESKGNPVVPPVKVHWGFQSLDEMGSVDLFVYPANTRNGKGKKDLQTLREAYRDHLVWQAGKHLFSPHKLKFAEDFRRQAINRFDLNQNAFLDIEERELARQWLKENSP